MVGDIRESTGANAWWAAGAGSHGHDRRPKLGVPY